MWVGPKELFCFVQSSSLINFSVTEPIFLYNRVKMFELGTNNYRGKLMHRFLASLITKTIDQG